MTDHLGCGYGQGPLFFWGYVYQSDSWLLQGGYVIVVSA